MGFFFSYRMLSLSRRSGFPTALSVLLTHSLPPFPPEGKTSAGFPLGFSPSPISPLSPGLPVSRFPPWLFTLSWGGATWAFPGLLLPARGLRGPVPGPWGLSRGRGVGPGAWPRTRPYRHPACGNGRRRRALAHAQCEVRKGRGRGGGDDAPVVT